MLYLKLIINGVGNYYLEAQTRDARRTDVIVDYLDYYRLNKGICSALILIRSGKPELKQ